MLALLTLGLVAHIILRKSGDTGLSWLPRMGSSASGASDQSSTGVNPATVEALKTYKGTRLLYNLKPQDQKLLLGAVDHFCVKAYQRESCVHYLITCGVPCITVIPRPLRKRIIDDYQALRVGKGLAPLPLAPNGN